MHSTSVHQPGNEDLDVDREDGSGDRANHLRKVLWKYCEASDRQAWLQVLTSFVPFSWDGWQWGIACTIPIG
ncbi:hypothetical protein HC928_19215 [bacterium]|nr:hypothetical protein [bacterium]